MREQIEGSRAIARTVARCRPNVVAAYPISPQTHIVEELSDLVRSGELDRCEYLTVESEFAAMSACIGAAAVGARAYTASASQGLLYMAEAVYNAAGLGLPIVMTVANRAIGAPINIWNDHSDSMALRDAGWIQLHAASAQEAVDLHLQAFVLAERLSLPVMVCMDGFVLTHAVEEVEVPLQEDADRFVPPFVPRQALDPDAPVTIGAMVGPEAFTEVRYLVQRHLSGALHVLPEVAYDFHRRFGRRAGGLVSAYRAQNADTVLVTIGSAAGAAHEVVDQLRGRGIAAGSLAVTCFRPWPADAVRTALAGARQVIVVERAFSPGSGSILGRDVRDALPDRTEVIEVVAGLGGRPVRRAGLLRLVEDVQAYRIRPGRLHFLDLDRGLLARATAGEEGP
ncbi:pyruvate ferredoxin oxidoreductase [Nocardioides soli]|uniref:Pyruvate ferredoxin oxidoreductase alpha subunit n=1 Tax=Nocardioides soli TaxID=1036020 RepID=A0A7W4VYQ4_9ACTN|nr:pyruvate ferredoxin oxidoreductase alpha subunit [Nocardioides soli]